MVSFADVGKMWGVSIKFRLIHNLLKVPGTQDQKEENSENNFTERQMFWPTIWSSSGLAPRITPDYLGIILNLKHLIEEPNDN